ncbi:MAG: hypothetical protein L6V86_00040 [Treponema sp.]|nr:MAG: hypothetical protein L6V86_00040 [Treponema sp.]
MILSIPAESSSVLTATLSVSFTIDVYAPSSIDTEAASALFTLALGSSFPPHHCLCN